MQIMGVMIEMKDQGWYIAEFNIRTEGFDPEIAHDNADDLLIEILYDIGFDVLANRYKELVKWYS